MQMKFQRTHIAAFAALSGDRSPIHLDEDHARRTPYGEVLVHGIATVLESIGKWSKGRSFRLLHLQASFKKPIFLNVAYGLEVHEEGRNVDLRVLRGGLPQVRIQFEWGEPAEDTTSPLAPSGRSGLQLLRHAKSAPQVGAFRVDYAMSRDALSVFHQEFSLAPGQLSASQLEVLCASSYVIGMEIPGERALFSDLSISFAEKNPTEPFHFQGEATYDERFHRWTLQGRGGGAESMTMSAFERPAPFSIQLADVEAVVGRSDRWAGKTVLVTGAARGFGAILSRALSLQGASLLLPVRQEGEDSRRLARELEEIGARATLVTCDLRDESALQDLASILLRQQIRLDACIHAAWPAIKPALFQELAPGEFMDGFSLPVRMAVNLLHTVLPHLGKKGLFVNISSVIVANPETRFAEYAASKGALEDLMRVVSLEYPHLRAVSARLPRILTDQTNLAYDPDPPVSGIAICKRLLDQLTVQSEATGYLSLDLYE